MNLFDYDAIESDRAANYNENGYVYLQSSSRDNIKNIRNQLEYWYLNYPEEEKYEIKERIKSDEHFNSVLFEMFLHNLFTEMDFQVKSHPSMVDSNKRPDFLITKEDTGLLVEAKVDSSISEKEKSALNRRNQVIDNINKIKSEKYRIILLEFKILSANQPSIKGFRKYIEQHFQTLLYEEQIKLTKQGREYLKEFMYYDEEIYMKYKIFAIQNGYRDNRLVQMEGANDAQWIDSCTSLRKSLDKKSKRYGEMEKPFIIAINSLDIFLDEKDVKDVVFGKIIDNVILDKERYIVKSIKYHKNNGFFSYNDSEKNNNVSGILIYKNLNIGNLLDPEYWFIHNPNALYPLSVNDFSLDCFVLKDNKFQKLHRNMG